MMPLYKYSESIGDCIQYVDDGKQSYTAAIQPDLLVVNHIIL